MIIDNRYYRIKLIFGYRLRALQHCHDMGAIKAQNYSLNTHKDVQTHSICIILQCNQQIIIFRTCFEYINIRNRYSIWFNWIKIGSCVKALIDIIYDCLFSHLGWNRGMPTDYCWHTPQISFVADEAIASAFIMNINLV